MAPFRIKEGARYISAILKSRRVLKRYAPSLWDKIVTRALVVSWHGAKAAVGLGGPDVLENMPDAALSNPQIIARGLGMMLGTLGSHLLKARMGGLRLVWSILIKVLMKTAAAAVEAAKMTAQQHAAEAQELVKAMRSSLPPALEMA